MLAPLGFVIIDPQEITSIFNMNFFLKLLLKKSDYYILILSKRLYLSEAFVKSFMISGMLYQVKDLLNPDKDY